jgi:hypothetical protein
MHNRPPFALCLLDTESAENKLVFLTVAALCPAVRLGHGNVDFCERHTVQLENVAAAGVGYGWTSNWKE